MTEPGTLSPAAWERMAANVERAVDDLWAQGAATGYGRGWQSRYRTLIGVFLGTNALGLDDATKAAALFGETVAPTLDAARNKMLSGVHGAIQSEIVNFIGYTGGTSTPPEIIRSVTARAQQSILHDWDVLTDDVRRAVGDTVQTSILTGQSTPEMARQLSQQTQFPRWRSELISRTEYRAAQDDAFLASMKAAGVKTWKWMASADSCPVCSLLHGTVHDTDAEVGRHPNCRCALIPNLDTIDLPQPGDYYSAAEKYDMLPAQAQAWAREAAPSMTHSGLSNLLMVRQNPKWKPNYVLPNQPLQSTAGYWDAVLSPPKMPPRLSAADGVPATPTPQPVPAVTGSTPKPTPKPTAAQAEAVKKSAAQAEADAAIDKAAESLEWAAQIKKNIDSLEKTAGPNLTPFHQQQLAAYKKKYNELTGTQTYPDTTPTPTPKPTPKPTPEPDPQPAATASPASGTTTASRTATPSHYSLTQTRQPRKRSARQGTYTQRSDGQWVDSKSGAVIRDPDAIAALERAKQFDPVDKWNGQPAPKRPKILETDTPDMARAKLEQYYAEHADWRIANGYGDAYVQGVGKRRMLDSEAGDTVSTPKSAGWTQSQLEAAQTYTGSSFRDINGSLRRTSGKANETSTYVRGTVQQIDDGFDTTVLGDDLLLQRGTDWQEFGIKNNPGYDLNGGSPFWDELPGSTFTNYAYTSAAANGGGFSSSVRLIIRPTANTRGMDVKEIGIYSKELEVLLDRGQRFFVHRVSKFADGEAGVAVEVEIIDSNIPLSVYDGLRPLPSNRGWNFYPVQDG